MAPSEDSFSLTCDISLIFIFAAATASNSLVLLVFYRRPGLRTLSNRFVINLLATNLLSCWILLPLILIDSVWRVSSNGMCAINQGVSTGLCAASVLSVLLIGLDQYYAVIDPLHYHSHIDNVRCAVMITASWIVSIVFGSLGGTFYGGASVWYACRSNEPVVPDIYLSVFCIVYSLLVFVLPFGCLCWMYVSIYTAAHKNSQRTRRNGSSAGFYTGNTVAANESPDYSAVPNSTQQQQQSGATTVTIQDSTSQLPPKNVDSPEQPVFVKSTLHRSPTRTSLRSTSSFIVNSLRYRISNASMFRYREETRAARISALVIVMGLVCWFPFTVVLLLNSPLWNRVVPHYISKLSLTLLASSAIITPLLFAHRNRRIQRDLRKLFGLARRPTSAYPGQQNQRRPAAQSQRNQKRVLPPNYSHNALELLGSLAEGADESAAASETRNQEITNNTDSVDTKNSSHFLSRVWCKHNGSSIVSKTDKVTGNALTSVPEIALDVDTSRSSFSSGGSSVTQRSTSAASISSTAEDF